MKTFYSIISILFFSFTGFAQAGNLDSTFGANGIVTTDFGSTIASIWSVAIQSDGKIVAAGRSKVDYYYSEDFAVARYNSSGNLDNTFGTDGRVITSFGLNEDSWAQSVAIQTDGKIVVAGFSENLSYDHFDLARYNTDGALDSIFGTDGLVTTLVGSGNAFAYSMAIQQDGKIVAAGSAYIDTATESVFALVRYNPDGTLDSSFSADGKVTTDIGSGYDDARSVAIQSDGKIVAVGEDGLGNAFALVRYNMDGSLDSSFDGDGIVTTNISSGYDLAFSVAVQSDGKIVAAGVSYTDFMDIDFAIVRYNMDGSLDSSFAEDGIVTTDIGSGNDEALSVAIQSDGKIVAAGSTGNFPQLDFALVRYNMDGTLDSSFAEDGIVTTDIGSGIDEANSVAIQPDGEIVAAGYSSLDFAVARYLDNLALGTINFSSLSSPLIYPNPIQQTEQLKYALTKDEVLSLSLYNVNGRVIKTFFTNEPRIAGEHTEELNFGNLAAGNYLLTLSNGSAKVSVKIVKQ